MLSQPNITVTPFEREDIPALAEIEREEFSIPFKEKDFEDLYNSSYSYVLVARQGEAVVGYVSFNIIIDECSIINFATKNEFKRQGVGKKLMDTLISHCKGCGVRKVFLEVRVSNAPAIALYEKYGFEGVGISKNHFSAPREDAILMNLEF